MMTATEIQTTAAEARTVNAWLKEIAYQLAVINESRSAPISSMAPASNSVTPEKKRK